MVERHCGHGGLGIYVWMAKHRQQHVTCGNLHAKEVEALCCLDLQDDPQDWKLLSSWLSDADMGGRWEATEVIGWMVALSFYAMFLVTGIAGIASGVMKSDLGNAFIGIMFMTAG